MRENTAGALPSPTMLRRNAMLPRIDSNVLDGYPVPTPSGRPEQSR
jgi:hypothetical protein